MDIFMIWVSDPADPAQQYWIEDAWDDDAISMNAEGWEAAKDKAYEQWGPENVRIVVTTVDMSAIAAAFQPTRVSAAALRDPKDALFQQRVHMTQVLHELRDVIPSDNPEGRQQRRGIQRAIKTIDRMED